MSLFQGPLRRRWLRQRRSVTAPVDSEIKQMRDAKEAEWKMRGYPDALIEQALTLADGWSSSMGQAFGSNPEVRASIVQGSYPKALENGEAWIIAMLK